MPLLDGLYAADQTLAESAPLLGLARRVHRSTRGLPMSFRDKPFLVELYDKMPGFDEVDIQKGVQVGVSELLLLYNLYASGWLGRICAYVLPTYTIRDRFVQQRLDPLLSSVAEYRERLPGGGGEATRGASNLKRKRFGRGSLMFLGSNTEGDFLEFSADVLIIDEFDQCDPTNLAKARDRVRESPHQQIIRIGNPTLPRIGISRRYDESDGRLWHQRCDHCGERQPIVWDVNVVERADDGSWIPRDRERARDSIRMVSRSRAITLAGAPDIRPVCRRCRKPFNRSGDRALWVAERPESGARPGYLIARTDGLGDRFSDLFVEFIEAQGRSERLAAFYTSILGRGYEQAGAALTVSELEACAIGDEIDHVGSERYAAEVMTAGIDVGTVINVVVSIVMPPLAEGQEPVRRAVYVGAVRTPEEVFEILRRYRVRYAVIDSQPEARMAQNLRDKCIEETETQVWLCRFHKTPRVGKARYGWSLDWQGQIVVADRTQVFDASTDDFRVGTRVYPSDVFTVLGWSDQMTAPKRVLDEAASRIKWTEGSDPDHYRLADVYDRIAFDLSQEGGSYFSG